MITNPRSAVLGAIGLIVLALCSCADLDGRGVWGDTVEAPLEEPAEKSGAATVEYSAVDRQTYESVQALASHAEVAVLGTVTGIRGTEMEGADEGDPGMEITFYGVRVDEVLASSDVELEVRPQETLAVADIGGSFEGDADLVDGRQMVLFLEQLTPTDDLFMETEDVFYVIIGTVDGAFDVHDGSVFPQSELVHGMTASEAGSAAAAAAPFTTSLDALRAYLAAR